CRFDAESPQCSHASDAEHDLLHDARFLVATIEVVGDVAIFGKGILLDVGIKEVDRYPSDIEPPDARPDSAAWKLHGDTNWPWLLVDHLGKRKIGGIVVVIVLQLDAVLRQALAEVAHLVHQTDTDEGEAEIAGRFGMVTRQHPESTRIERYRLMQSELCREI